MASLLTLHLLIFSLISFTTVVLPLPSLLSINCTPPFQKAHQVQSSSFTQCRLDLTPKNCTLCAQNAKQTISNLCPTADAVSAWFDGCYIEYDHNNSTTSSLVHLESTAAWFCSHQATAVDRSGQFELVLEILLLRLRSDVNLATHLGFSTGEIKYGNGSSVYALAECVRYLSPKECEVCVGKGIEKLYKYCGGKEGGTVVAGYCTVRYESFRFFSDLENAGGPDSDGGSGAVPIRESGKGGCIGFKVKAALVWGAGIVCVALVLLSGWLMRRSVINKAKISSFGDGDDDELGTKGVV
ncbi:cysteine-rich repeat secretory protein 38-like [Corylus avellana]|uniref:cysteine-rich repeat secretory protein 38-like n=1 Tax=Corylus avellana TaxID=13451 RepID=UPI00286A2E9C|nr:cysteine-rich repeat secretory protein 38-like [Corylus avellana]